MINDLVILTPADENKAPTKTLDKDLNIVTSYPKGMKEFYFDKIEYESFHKALEKVFKFKNSFIVLGKLTKLGEYHFESQKAGLRRKKDPGATLMDNNSTEMVLDLDDHILEGFDPLDPVPAIEYFLQEMRIDCDVTYQITSSQRLVSSDNPEPLARIRLYFMSHKRFSLKERKAWSQMVPESDGSVYTCSQPIYTAAPNIIGSTDPIPNRTGFIKGARRTFVLPKLTETEVRNNSSYSRNSNYDFEDQTIPEEVLSGRVYRRYFMPLAFHYANKIQDAEAIFYIIAGKAQRVASREFNEQNVREYIRDALNQIKIEKLSTKEEIDLNKEKQEEIEVPIFPKNISKCMPPPIRILWNEFKKLPIGINETLLFPTFLAVHGYILRGKFVNKEGRIPNTLSLALAQSGVGKDVNSTDVIELLDKLVRERKGPDAKKSLKTIFSDITHSPDDITGGTSLLKSFGDGQDLFWVYTEATNVFRMLKNSSQNAHVKSLSNKLINGYDGKVIKGTGMSSGKVKGVNKPNFHTLWYAQQGTIKETMNMELVESGFFGRMNLYIVPEVDMSKQEIDFFPTRTEKNSVEYRKDVLNFYGDNVWNLLEMDRNNQEPCMIPKDMKIKINRIMNKMIQEHKNDVVKLPIIKRLGQSIESIYAIFLGMSKMWYGFKGEKEHANFDPEILIPLIRYLMDAKMYAIDALISKSVDPVFEAIFKEINKIANGTKKTQGKKAQEILNEFGLVQKSIIKINLSRSKDLKEELGSMNNDKDLGNKISITMGVMIKDGVLVEKEIDRGLYIGIKRND